MPAVSLKTLTFSVVFAQNPLGCCQPSPRPGLSSHNISLQEQLITGEKGHCADSSFLLLVFSRLDLATYLLTGLELAV